MALGALLDCGGDEAALRASLDALQVPGYELTIARVKREGITATDVDVRLLEVDQGHGRHLSDIAGILEGSGLKPRVRERALAVFTRLADAEAAIHGTSRDEIHFHEVGAVDAIVDIVGACILLEQLGVEQVFLSPLPCGWGTVNCQHGIMPIPAPATMRLLHGFPVRAVDIEGELVTPTGAALLTTLADQATAGRMPSMRILASGFGAGKKQFVPDMPNLLRVVIGEIVAPSAGADPTPHTVTVLETNLDDQTPEASGRLMERCLEEGAVDVFFTPVQMKKNRPGTLITVLCRPADTDRIADLLFRETSTFGIRYRSQERFTLERSRVLVATPFGEIGIKVGSRGGEVMTESPEFDDCRRAAITAGVPLQRVYQAAVSARENGAVTPLIPAA